MKKQYFVLVFLLLFMMGCNSSTSEETGTNRKIVSGKITGKIGEEFILQLENGDLININSRKYEMSNYIGKDIKAEGMYSGSTLYIDKMD